VAKGEARHLAEDDLRPALVVDELGEQVAERGDHLLARGHRFEALVHAGEPAVGVRAHDVGEQPLLRPVVPGDRAAAHAGLRGDAVEGRARHAPRADALARRGDEPLARRGCDPTPRRSAAETPSSAFTAADMVRESP